jgi:hypothetical protein
MSRRPWRRGPLAKSVPVCHCLSNEKARLVGRFRVMLRVKQPLFPFCFRQFGRVHSLILVKMWTFWEIPTLNSTSLWLCQLIIEIAENFLGGKNRVSQRACHGVFCFFALFFQATSKDLPNSPFNNRVVSLDFPPQSRKDSCHRTWRISSQIYHPPKMFPTIFDFLVSMHNHCIA